MPTYVNGNETGILIETCAGLLDKDNAEDCIRRETEEETGYKVTDVKKIFEAYMSPGLVTEILYFFIAAYTKEMKANEGGGVESKQENIEVLEIDIEEAMTMIESAEIKDGKTTQTLANIINTEETEYTEINQLIKKKKNEKNNFSKHFDIISINKSCSPSKRQFENPQSAGHICISDW